MTQRVATKIRAHQLERAALIYVRQSTLAQVRHHTASTQRQYDLVQRARDLGWAREQIQVIDQDQGQSGASAAHRDGFQVLVAQVGLGHAGAVFCLEASRLARSCSDWYRLLEICALADTLVIDEEGIYDPGDYNDRLLLGFKGTMSEAELHWLRQRLQGGLWEKARQGTLRLPLPTGFVYDAAGRVTLDPDEAVQAAVRLVFDRFEQLGSALAVVRHLAQHQLAFPTRPRRGPRKGELIWRPLALGRLITILHNPVYAGAYAYGRSWGAPRGAGARPGRGAPEEPILIQDAHPGYISWEQYQHNQRQLEDNRPASAPHRRGAIRAGAALLQGIVVCGRCGRRMTVLYLDGGQTPAYHCRHTQHAGPSCQWVHGGAVDAAVARVLLEALQPAQLAISLAALEQIEARERQIERQWALRLERAQYEADLARRRFVAVEPENRLVARSLEREWNAKLAEVARLESEAAQRAALPAARVSAAEREKILALARDVPAVWHAATTTSAERKQLLRLLVRDVTLTRGEKKVQLGVRWQTGAVTEEEIARPPKLWERWVTSPSVIERIRALAPGRTDREIAACLNQEGHRSARGHAFTASHVAARRRQAGIATGWVAGPAVSGAAAQQEGRVSAGEAAQQLGCHVDTVIQWCQRGRLEGVQTTPHGAWWVWLPPEKIMALRSALERKRGGKPGPTQTEV